MRHIVDGTSSQQTTRIFFFRSHSYKLLSTMVDERCSKEFSVQVSTMFVTVYLVIVMCFEHQNPLSPVIITERECSQSIGIFQLLTRALRALGNRISTFVFFREEEMYPSSRKRTIIFFVKLDRQSWMWVDHQRKVPLHMFEFLVIFDEFIKYIFSYFFVLSMMFTSWYE